MTDKMREEFETAVALEAKEPVLSVYLSRRGDTYSTSTLHFAWWAWKASRETLAVNIELEDWPTSIALEIQQAIEAAGLKVAP